MSSGVDTAPTAARSGDEARDRVAALLRAVAVFWLVGTLTVFPLWNAHLERVSVLTADRIAFLLCAGLLAIHLLRDRRMLLGFGRVERAMAIYLAVALLSWATILPGRDPIAIKRDLDLILTSLLMPYTLFLIARHVAWTRGELLRDAWLLLFVASAFLVATGLYQAVVDWRFLVENPEVAIHRTRPRGPFPNALLYTIALALLLLVAIFVAVQDRRERRWLAAAAVPFLIEMLVLGKMRVIWISLPLALLFLAAVRPAARRWTVGCAAAVVAAFVLTFAAGDFDWIAGRGGALGQSNASVAARATDPEPFFNRVAVYATALNMISSRPIFGFGFGGRTFLDHKSDFYASCCGVSPKFAEVCAVPHNEILSQLVLMGAVGLVAWLFLVLALWRSLADARSGPDDARGTLAACVQSALLLLGATGMLHDVMYLSQVQALTLFLAGLATPAVPEGA